MSENYKIEKGIPMPDSHWTGLSRVITTMEVGDSIVIRLKQKNHAYQVAYRKGWKMRTNQLPDGTMRVWRVA